MGPDYPRRGGVGCAGPFHEGHGKVGRRARHGTRRTGSHGQGARSLQGCPAQGELRNLKECVNLERRPKGEKQKASGDRPACYLKVVSCKSAVRKRAQRDRRASTAAGSPILADPLPACFRLTEWWPGQNCLCQVSTQYAGCRSVP